MISEILQSIGLGALVVSAIIFIPYLVEKLGNRLLGEKREERYDEAWRSGFIMLIFISWVLSILYLLGQFILFIS